MKVYKTVCLCGSTKFKDKFLEKARELTLDGYVVLMPNVFGHSGDRFPEGKKTMLDHMHKQKIDMSDAVYIINIDNYIGESTRSELEYAKEKDKEILFLEPFTDFTIECKWKRVDKGTMGFRDYVYKTDCGKEIEEKKVSNFEFCPYCSSKVLFT